MQLLLEIDSALFVFLNHLPHPFIANWLGLFLSSSGSFGIIWLLIEARNFIHSKKQTFHIFIPLTVSLLTCYIVVELLMKPFVARLRPDQSLAAIVVDVVNWGYSFPSGHAAYAFAGAVIMSTFYNKFRALFYLLAIIISLSRIYLGKHYPLDVFGGACVGVIIGQLSLFMNRMLHRNKSK